MYGDSSRKPSGSSTHSGSHSPTASPNSVPPPRKITPTSTGNMLSVGVGANGRNGWPVWDSGSPSSRRNPSISSATSGHELSAGQTYRAGFGEAWPSSRPNSGTWDDALDTAQKKDLAQVQDAALTLHPTQRQSVPFSGQPRIVNDDRSPGPGSKKAQFSPQRYENGVGKESRYASGTSPTRGPFQVPMGATAKPPAVAVEDLSLALRGMSVEDDFATRQQVPGQAINPSMRGPAPSMRPYPSYPPPPPTDYGGYYAGRDAYLEYPYGFEAYHTHAPSDPSLSMFPSPALANATPAAVYSPIGPPSYGSVTMPASDIRPPGVFFDYGAPRPPASQYFYPGPPQAIIFPQPQPLSPVPATLSEKKRDLSISIQQHLSQSMRYGHSRAQTQSFGSAMEYPTSQVPFFGGGMQVYPHGLGMRPGRRDGGHPGLSLRSPILDEFRTNKARKWELHDIIGFIVEFAGDQHGSRFIQQKLEVASGEEKQAVFDEIVPGNTLHLMQDVFGNYVIQKLFEYGSPVHKAILASTMEGHILKLSLQVYGCRVVQKAIEYLPVDQQVVFVRELEPHVLQCVKDANGNHVIQKMVEYVPSELLGFIETFQGHVAELATHTYGCRVLQRCLDRLPQDRTRALLDELNNHTLALMQDNFGNYVVQFVLEKGAPHDRTMVLMNLRGHMLAMSRHKFASNVCEKALLCADPESRRILVEEIMLPEQEGINPIVMMMKDQYANYVLQRALAVVEGHQREQLCALIRPHLANMRKHSSAYSKHLAAIEKLLDHIHEPREYQSIPEVVIARTVSQ